jgi:hypothetical protein
METGSNIAPQPERKPSTLGILKFLFVVVLFVLFLLLARSMVNHRFFQGQRVHLNGSLGQ